VGLPCMCVWGTGVSGVAVHVCVGERSVWGCHARVCGGRECECYIGRYLLSNFPYWCRTTICKDTFTSGSSTILVNILHTNLIPRHIMRMGL